MPAAFPLSRATANVAVFVLERCKRLDAIADALEKGGGHG